MEEFDSIVNWKLYHILNNSEEHTLELIREAIEELLKNYSKDENN